MTDDPTRTPDARTAPVPASLPDVLLVGAPKSASTAIAAWIDDHPECAVTRPKEPHYWCFDLPGLRRRVGADPALYASIVDRARSHGRVVVEASTTSLMSEVAARAIVDAQPSTKFIALVRDPMQLIPSYFETQHIAENEDEPSLARALELTDRRRRGMDLAPRCSDPAMVDYRRVGMNGEHVERLLRVAGADHVHVIVFDDIVDRHDEVCSRLCDFLGVAPGEHPLELVHEGGRRPRFEALHRFAVHPPSVIKRPMLWLRRRTERPRSPALRRLKQTMWREHRRPGLDREAQLIIRDWFADDVALLARTIDRDLGHWLATDDA